MPRPSLLGRPRFCNEFSLQHELGIYLRERLPGYRVQFERNVSFFSSHRTSWTKREIDISVFSPTNGERPYAIELKYPRNGQYPEQMFSFCKDIAFAEEMRDAQFTRTGLVVFADDPLFYSGAPEGIYGYFRGGRPLHGRIEKPTGKRDAAVQIGGAYTVGWTPVAGQLRYAVIETAPVKPSPTPT